MSRAGYSDDIDDPLELGRWRGQVKSAIRGKRGQAFLRELLAALDAMPEKRLVQGAFEVDGEVCALGCVAKARGMDNQKFDPEDAEDVGGAFGIANPLAREIMWENDEYISDYRWIEVPLCGPVRPHWPDYGNAVRRVLEWDSTAAAKRWEHMRKWVADQIALPATTNSEQGS